MTAEFIDCRMNAKITLEQCMKRQLVASFYKPRRTDPRFMSCGACRHFLSDDEFEAAMKGRKLQSIFNVPFKGRR